MPRRAAARDEPSGQNRRSTAERRGFVSEADQRAVKGTLIRASQFFDLILQLQFLSLERRQLEVVRARMSQLIRDLAFQSLMFPFKFRQIVLQHHVGLSCGYSDPPSVPQWDIKSIPNFMLRCRIARHPCCCPKRCGDAYLGSLPPSL